MRRAAALGLLALLPALAHAPAVWSGHLVTPGDGAFLHFPLRGAVLESWRRGELPAWNPGLFLGTPLLAAYRPGALYPPQLALAFLPPFAAYQLLVLLSLSAAGVLTYLYLRRLGAHEVGAYVGGLGFALGPYLVGHLDDAATVVAAPLLPLVLLAAEAHARRASRARAAGLAAALALLLLAGSPEAARAGLTLAFGRLLVAHLFPAPGGPSLRLSALAVACGLGLAAPQLAPTLLASREAGRAVTGFADSGDLLPGLTGLVLRYVSHTPAPALALAALPLLLTELPVRVLGIALVLCLGLQWGRGPLAAPGALALVFDLTLAILAGLSLGRQWQERGTPLGRRLRAYFLLAALACSAALSVAAALLGPLPQTLAGAVGVLALALILYFSLVESRDPVAASVFLLPLTVSFLLQPHGRGAWDGSPTRERLLLGTPTSAAVESALGPLRGERVLTLARSWPSAEQEDLLHGNLGLLHGRRSAGGYDPVVSLRRRRVFDGMSVAGALPGAFFRTDPLRLVALGVRFAQVPVSALRAPWDAWGLGDTLDAVIEEGRPRLFPVPIAAATELRLASSLSDAVLVPQAEPVARIVVRLASGRALPLLVRAGLETAEWAYDRPDVRPLVAHERAPLLESWPGPGGGFPAHRYLGILRLPGRFLVDGIRVERLPGRGHFTLARMALADTSVGRFTPVSLASAYVSDERAFREVAATPLVRLYEVRGGLGQAWVVGAVRTLADDDAVVQALRLPGAAGFDPAREALVAQGDAPLTLPAGARPSRAVVVRAQGSRMQLRAEGPGLLVVAEGFDRGWSAAVDGSAAGILRVNHTLMGVPLPSGMHRVDLRYRPRGLGAGLALVAVSGLALLFAGRRPLD